jgi:hypothetical protein
MTESKKSVFQSSTELVGMELVKSGKRVILARGVEAIVIKKVKNKSMFKEVYPWIVTLGTKEGEVIKQELKADGVSFRHLNGTVSENSIIKIL